MKIASFGAAEGVTGSCHWVEASGTKFLVDCGLFQGEQKEEDRNSAPFPFDPRELDFVLLTHAHLDHCGRLPRLVKEGFHGGIVTTPATRDIVRFILLDVAHLQHEEFTRGDRRGRRAGRPVPLPLYGVEEVTYTFDLIDPRANYEETLELAPGVRATFRNAGHILGAAFVELEVRENGSAKRVTFSGDLGNPGRPVIPDAVLPHPSDLVLVETTYGDRDHRSVGDSNAELGEVVRKTIGQGGNVVIPTFALERAQDVLFALGELRRAGEIPQCPIYLDSPLAIDITSVYRRYPDSLGEPLNRMISSGEKPFVFEGVSLTRAVDESKRINGVSGAIILAGSGMCHGGRILHHLRHNLWREDSSVVLVGYQAKGTLGRALVDGAERVHIYGEEIQVRATIHTINGFSAHADRTGLIHWLEPCRGGRVRLIHGEMRALAAFKTLAEDRLDMQAEIARFGESVSV